MKKQITFLALLGILLVPNLLNAKPHVKCSSTGRVAEYHAAEPNQLNGNPAYNLKGTPRVSFTCGYVCGSTFYTNAGCPLGQRYGDMLNQTFICNVDGNGNIFSCISQSTGQSASQQSVSFMDAVCNMCQTQTN